MYLYHWPIFLWLNPERTGLDGAALFGLRLAVTLAVATVSWHYLEQPILHGRRITGWRPAVARAGGRGRGRGAVRHPCPGAVTQPTIVFERGPQPDDGARRRRRTPPGTGATDRRRPRRLPSRSPRDRARVRAPAVPSPPPPPVRRILLLGDSVAQTLGRGLERWGPTHGVIVVNAARFYCGIARGGRLGALLGRNTRHLRRLGRGLAPLLDRVRPDVVVMLSTIWDVGARQRDEWGPDYLDEGDPPFDQFIIDEWGRAADLLRSRGARVVWLTIPCSTPPGLTHTHELRERQLPPSR